MGVFAISESEYTKHRDLFKFCRWVNDVLRVADKHPKFSQSYFEQEEQLVKKFLEEAIPIMRLGLYLYRAPARISIKCTVRNEPYDGIIKLKSPSIPERSLKVEVTTTEDHETALIRELLARDGFAYLDGEVRRDGEHIINKAEMVDVREKEQAIKARAIHRLKKKVESGRYGRDTVILVYVTKITSARPVSLLARDALVKEAWQYLTEVQADIAGVFFCYESNHAIDEIEPWPRPKSA